MKFDKKYLVYTIVLIVLIGFIFVNYFISENIPKGAINVNRACISELEKRIQEQPNVNYQQGTILVRFHENATEKEAIELIESYGLGAEYSWKHDIANAVTIFVPRGDETKWVCVFRSNHLVKDSHWSTILKVGDET